MRDGENQADPPPKFGFRDILRNKSALLAIFQFSVTALTWTAFLDVFPLWCAATRSVHGLEWTSDRVGVSYLISGIGVLVFMLTVFSRIIDRYSTRQAFLFTLAAELVLLSVVPCIPYLVTNPTLLLLVVAGNFIVQQIVNAVLSTTMNVMTNRSVHPCLRGRLNGITMGLGSLMRALGAALFAQYFAFGVSEFNSTFLTFWTMSILELFVLVVLYRHPVHEYVALP
eukprot:c20480_g2_i1.p1 GENE.c20480_g2_i1~~c20480_g2_i1.p1  ORF type:complete len:227 (-),score=56.40 c20480_g2_i1:82-762(-)